jgi:predicted lipid-binding transport protein (Tim44 family)
MGELWGTYKARRTPSWADVRARGAWPTFLYSMLDGLVRGVLFGVFMGLAVFGGGFPGRDGVGAGGIFSGRWARRWLSHRLGQVGSQRQRKGIRGDEGVRGAAA